MRCGNWEVILFLPFLTLLLISLTFLLNCRYGADASIGPPVTLKMVPQAIVWITVWEERRTEGLLLPLTILLWVQRAPYYMSFIIFIIFIWSKYAVYCLYITCIYLIIHSVTNYAQCVWFIFWMPDNSHRTHLFPVQLSFRKNVSVDLQKEQCGIKS